MVMELDPKITTEIDVIFDSLESAKGDIAKKFESILNEFTHSALQRFQDTIELDERWNYSSWIRSTCDNIIEGLLSGDTKWLKHQAIISEYSWDKLKAVRMAILKANGEEIENAVIRTQLVEIEQLKKDVKFYREMSQRY